MKKSIIIFIITIITLTSILSSCNSQESTSKDTKETESFENFSETVSQEIKSFTDTKSSDFKSIELYAPGGEKIFYTLNDKETNDFIKILNNVVLNGIGNEKYKNANGGQSKMFRLTDKNGDVLILSSFSPFLIVNDKGYYQSNEILNDLYNIWRQCVLREWNSENSK